MEFGTVLLTGILWQMAAAVLHGFTEKQLSTMFETYEIIHPMQVDEAGNFLSYHIAYHEHQHERHRRSLRFTRAEESIVDTHHSKWRNETIITSTRSPTKSNELFKPMYYNVTLSGLSYHITLLGKTRLIAPDAKVVQYSASGKQAKSIKSDCVYTGYVTNQPYSKVAVTSCNGLSGLIKTEVGEFFIEPLESVNDLNTPGIPQRHIVYKRMDQMTKKPGQNLQHNETMNKQQLRLGQLSEDFKLIMETRKNNAVNEKADNGNKGISDNIGNRSKRHAKKKDYNMEVLLTADEEVIQFHGREHVENYLITLINIVDEIYHDDSSGAHINIVLVRLCLLDQSRSKNLIAHEDPSASLKNVCKWANDMQLDDPLPTGRTHDHAIFLTRKNFGPAGYAHVAGMCHPLRSCTLNHEDGFSSAFVVAHETGHVLGMEHDGEGNKCSDETSMGSIMAPLVQAAFHRYHWSRCSQQELETHIGKFGCLTDNPLKPDWGPTPMYPGVIYTMDDQCRFDFGTGYKQCTTFQNLDVCRTLWCSHDDNPMFCKTKNGPPVDGTECGNNMWCFKSHCVWRQQRGWSNWSSFGECSRSCGTGVRIRRRECDNSTGSCSGERSEYDLCNKRPCAGFGDYRAEQCKRHRSLEYANRRHTWLPYESEHDDLKCELFCVSKETNDILSMGMPVADGTPCSYDDPHGICIDAECVRMGCDKVLGSMRREDQCGVCGGDGSQCRQMNGTYRKLVRRPYNSYMKMFSIPANARKIQIREATPVKPIHILAMKNRRTSRYILNQRNKLIDGDVQMFFVDAGTKWTYIRKNNRETITAPGPTSVEIVIMLISRGVAKKSIIHYSYILHSRDRSNEIYQYELRKWYPCSATCGTGTRLSRYGCRSKSSGKWVRKIHCSGSIPKRIRQQCSVAECQTVRWYVGDWASCSKTCGGGQQVRRVICQQRDNAKNWNAVNDNLCKHEPKPTRQRACSRQLCHPRWRISAWSVCSVSCGTGVRRRRIICQVTTDKAASNAHCLKPQPPKVESCQKGVCTEKLCEKDQSILCKLDSMAKYCSIPGYHQLCCRSCQTHLVEQRENASLRGRSVNDSTSTLFNSVALQHGTVGSALDTSNNLTQQNNLANASGYSNVEILSGHKLGVTNGTPKGHSPPLLHMAANSERATQKSRHRRSVHSQKTRRNVILKIIGGEN